MRLAIMQPYLFPYLGYFQLIAAVDRFVFYDDVNFIRQGWINRNRLLERDRAVYFTVPVVQASSFRTIRGTRIDYRGAWREKLLRTVTQNYGKAPHLAPVYDLVRKVLEPEAEDIGTLAQRSVDAVCDLLEIRSDRVSAASRYGNETLRGSARVLDICRREGAKVYVNAPGGRALYDAETFRREGLDLRFLCPRPVAYEQLGAPFVPGLSIIDVLMFNAPAVARGLLTEYDLE